MNLHQLSRYDLPAGLTALAVLAALLHGPIAQFPDYHDFADQSLWLGVAHAGDVLSNAAFALVAWLGWRQVGRCGDHPALHHGWAGYRLFFIGLLLTAAGSTWYHLAPDNARLVWDRLPIALACAGLLAGVWGDCHQHDSRTPAALLALAAVISVAWWHFTGLHGVGDLRSYLLLQGLPLVLIPLWQWLYRRPGRERAGCAVALSLYVLAKLAELNDHALAQLLAPLTGHTLKHLLAAGAAALLVRVLSERLRSADGELRAHCPA